MSAEASKPENINRAGTFRFVPLLTQSLWHDMISTVALNLCFVYGSGNSRQEGAANLSIKPCYCSSIFVFILFCKDCLYGRSFYAGGRHGHDRMVVGYLTTCAIIAYHHYICEFEPCSWRGILDTTLYDKNCQWLATGRWFSLGTPVSSTNKTDHHYITEILLKVMLNTINSPKFNKVWKCRVFLFNELKFL